MGVEQSTRSMDAHRMRPPLVHKGKRGGKGDDRYRSAGKKRGRDGAPHALEEGVMEICSGSGVWGVVAL